MELATLKERIEAHIESATALIETHMAVHGNKSEHCQRMNCLNALRRFAHTVTGIESDDLNPA